MARYGGFRTGVTAKKGEWGYVELRSISQSGKELSWTFVHPDGGPATDRTVVRVDLAEPIPPGGTGVLDIEFHDKLPRVVARTGYFGSYHLVGQWFPKIGVLELPGERGATAPRWNCHELHLNSEFYADFGSYDVSITAPKEFVVGAVGEEQGAPVETPQGLRHHFVQGDVHDFAFAAWDRFQTLTASTRARAAARRGEGPLLEGVRESPHHPRRNRRIDPLLLRDARAYPYRTSTAIVPPFNATESAGMEYETFFTSYGVPGDPMLAAVRFVVVHEFGHGYFMGILASNEFEEPMLDEGLNEFWDTRLIAKAPVSFRIPALSRLGFPSLPLDWYDYERGGNPRNPPDPIAGNSWHRYSEATYNLIYTRTTLTFHDLATRIGDDVLARAMREYYRRWRFRHPSTADLRAVFEEVSGRKDVVDRWFDEQVYDARSIDDRIETVESAEILPQPGMVIRDGKRVELDQEAIDKEIRTKREAFAKEHPKPRPGEPGPFPFRSVVVARRFGPAQVPQTVEVRFEDGSVERTQWDPADRWQSWTFEKPVRVASAQPDPERGFLLDLNKLDDGHARRRIGPSTRWTLEALGMDAGPPRAPGVAVITLLASSAVQPGTPSRRGSCPLRAGPAPSGGARGPARAAGPFAAPRPLPRAKDPAPSLDSPGTIGVTLSDTAAVTADQRDPIALNNSALASVVVERVFDGVTLIVARAEGTVRTRALLASAGENYGRLFRVALVGLVPIGAASALSGVLFHAARTSAERAIMESQAVRGDRLAILGALVLLFVAQLCVDAARGMFAAEPYRQSALAASWAGLRLVVRRPLRSLGLGLATLLVGGGAAALCLLAPADPAGRGRIGVSQPSSLHNSPRRESDGTGRPIVGSADLARADAADRERRAALAMRSRKPVPPPAPAPPPEGRSGILDALAPPVSAPPPAGPVPAERPLPATDPASPDDSLSDPRRSGT
jgi:hypothetical protein